ncbi:carbamate kinase [Pragia fontium]|uniref:Carbamate kinase n=2 Tax=Pragia fontium TaxID=82985 RepID=A0AAJ4WA85_9GAMM|nr:carbamate kinase [Pragia fontium]AKJ42495.1 carbamate kinase [Pragia fontium]SFC74912.1 carbamate kinase [Pragia fontium DSM 5563 = ATCC 49100]SUB82811.1 Carbamate kinase 2 [Pragia fontium]VEJ55709.1 Carbamate kinase 2 [Pragia fontium]GKX62681.1 carbamate kinase [Pragia fontium]
MDKSNKQYKTLVLALGGNALLQRNEVLSAENQYKNIAAVAKVVKTLSEDYNVVIVHGNGPQVGLLSLQNLAYEETPAYPLDILVAETQGMLGYMISQSLSEEAGMPPVSSVMTRVLVDNNDEAFADPTKFIGPVYNKESAEEAAKRYGWIMKEDGKYIRRVVPSPMPQSILDLDAINALIGMRHVVVCNGGGGVPVVKNSGAGYKGIEAVIDKDFSAALLAAELKADCLLVLTDADAVYQDWGTPNQRALRDVTTEELKPFAVADGSMGPKAQAVIGYVEKSGNPAFIGALHDAAQILKREKGTCIHL